jgi:orotidine-5'-phosphate decarboxylase
VPGVGAQGGRLEDVLAAGLTDQGNMIINISRGILYTGRSADYASDAELAANSLRDEINRVRGR